MNDAYSAVARTSILTLARIVALSSAAALFLAGCPRRVLCGDLVCSAGEQGVCAVDCPASCGNGTCDSGESATNCAADCMPGTCGDGMCGPGETAVSCAADCAGGTCGDGTIDPGEDCEPPGAGGCDPKCQFVEATCGNSTVEPGEECDPPNFTTCDALCQIIGGGVCGNATVEPGEQCDPPNGTTCDALCNFIGGGVCGDGLVQVGEQCDPPNGTTCNALCQNIAVGVVPGGAACTTVGDCGSSPFTGAVTDCITDAEWTGGYCIHYNCSTSADACPTGSQCACVASPCSVAADFACLGSCTPSATGNGACRGTVADYACFPLFLYGEGFCAPGCASTADCVDAAGTPTGDVCNTPSGLCTNAGNPAAEIGDPCSEFTEDTDCPPNSRCFDGDFWAGTNPAPFPGGYCMFTGGCSIDSGVFACSAYGGTCETAGAMVEMCVRACTGDGGSGTCDNAPRTVAEDYECMDIDSAAVAATGVSGHCFQCEEWNDPYGGALVCP